MVLRYLEFTPTIISDHKFVGNYEYISSDTRIILQDYK